MTFVPIDGQPQDVSDDPWLDMLFEVVDINVSEERITIECMASPGSYDMGFKLRLRRHWKSLFDQSGEVATLEASPAIITSIGKATEVWEGYVAGWPSGPSEVVDDPDDPPWDHAAGEITFAAIHLGDKDVDLAKDSTRLKFFHEKRPYFELFCNVDFPVRLLAINEKDPDYRQNMQRAFYRAWGQSN